MGGSGSRPAARRHATPGAGRGSVRAASRNAALAAGVVLFRRMEFARDQREAESAIGKQPPLLLSWPGTVEKERLCPEASGNQTMLDGQQGREYHERFKELNALASSGTLTPLEWSELNSHLEPREECRA